MATAKQYRNQGPSPHVIPAGPKPYSKAASPDVVAAFARAMSNAQVRQAQAKAWLDETPQAPVGAGDRVTALEGESGYVGGPVLGVASHPAVDPPLLPQRQDSPSGIGFPFSEQTTSDLGSARAVSHSPARPWSTPGTWLKTRPASSRPEFITVSAYGSLRERALATLRRIFGRRSA